MNKNLTRVFASAIVIFSNLIFLNAQSEVPAGTRITVRMTNGIDSKSASVDDTFTAQTIEAMRFGDAGTIPAETIFTGQVTIARSAQTRGRSGRLDVEFFRMRFPDGSERRISAVLVNRFSENKPGTLNAIAILAGTTAGGIIGYLTKAGNGGLIGAGAGAASGTGIALLRKGKDVGIKSNEEFEIELTKAVTLPADGF